MKTLRFETKDGEIRTFNPKYIVSATFVKDNSIWCLTLDVMGSKTGVFTKIYTSDDDFQKAMDYITTNMPHIIVSRTDSKVEYINPDFVIAANLVSDKTGETVTSWCISLELYANLVTNVYTMSFTDPADADRYYKYICSCIGA